MHQTLHLRGRERFELTLALFQRGEGSNDCEESHL